MGLLEFIRRVLSSGETPSSKRVVGVIAGVSLIVFMFVWHTELSVNLVFYLACTALGITSLEKIFKK